MVFNNLLYFSKNLINFICISFISILFLCLLNTMEIMSKVKYVFAKKINETEETGIIEVYSAKILCFCDEESSKFIIDSIEAKEQLPKLEQLQTPPAKLHGKIFKTEEPYDKNGFTQLGREFVRLNGKKISEQDGLVLPPPLKTAEELVLNYEDLTNAQKIIDDKTLDEIFGDSDFGRSWTKREILNNGVLKYASGYETGRTVQCICIALGLYDEKKGLTQKGREYLYAAYNGGKSV